MHANSRTKTAFTTYNGLYEFNVLPFGLCNAPSSCQRLMQVILAGLEAFSRVYLDDIIVYSQDMKEQLTHLEAAFARLRPAGLQLKPQKCHFFKSDIRFLGHIVTNQGFRADPAKTKAVQNFATSTTLKSLRSFLRLAFYYRQFVCDFPQIAHPLHHLLKHDVPFLWSKECQKSLDQLKTALVSATVLAYPKFDKPFVVETNASGYGLGAVVEHQQSDGQWHPVAYASRTLPPHEKSYGATELEALGVVWALKMFRPYLLGHSTIVYTDHSTLKSLFSMSHPSAKLARWAMMIQ